MKIASRTILSAAIVVLLCPLMAPPAQAQRAVSQRAVAGIQILVRNIDDRSEAVRVLPGGTVTIAEGAHVRVNVEAVLNGSRNPIYPVTEFTDLNRGGLQITRSNAANAAVDLMVLPMKNPNRIQRVGFQITDNRVPAGMRTGSFNIQVAAPSAVVGGSTQPGYSRPGYGQPGYGNNGGWGYDRARDLAQVLYRGILMRDLDPGAQGSIDAIRNGGYNGLVDAAVSIANSQESRITIPTRGVSAQERLESIYQNLLGLSSSQVDRSTWNADLRTLNDGYISRVVENIVRSDRFRSRYNL
jgi:hypothetical protein